MTKHVATIKFRDLDTSDEALVIIRYDESSVIIGLSLQSNGDMQVVMTRQTAKQVMERLRAAVES